MRPRVGEGWLCVHVVHLVGTVPIATEMAVRVVNDHSHRGDGLEMIALSWLCDVEALHTSSVVRC